MTNTPASPGVTQGVTPGFTDKVTYGELMDAARRAAHQGMNALARDRLPGAATAQATLTARARLLAGLGAHATALIGPVRVQAWRASAPHRHTSDARTPAVVAALAWIDALEARAGTLDTNPDQTHAAGPTTGAGTSALTHWRQAAALVARASDLVATHRDPTGALRQGAPAELAQAGLGPLLATTTRLVTVVAGTEPLALRCREAGMPRAMLDAHLPVGDRLLDDTWALARTLRFADTAIADLTLARPPIDATGPADEWTQRMTRVHARLHRHVTSGHVSVRTLHDIARLALVTSHVLDTSGRHDHAAQASVTDQWRTVLMHLDPLRGVTRPDRVLRHDVDRMLHLARPATTAANPAQQQALLHAITASVPVVNACSALAERALARSTDTWTPAPPRRGYLPDLHQPGQAATRAPPLEAPWPRTGPTPPTGPGLTPT